MLFGFSPFVDVFFFEGVLGFFFVLSKTVEKPIKLLFENSKWFSAQGKNLWSNFFH